MNQSAGNLHDEKGSSETTCATSYEDNNAQPPSGGDRNENNDQFGHWLAGLIDGDGTLSVSKKGYTSCEITLHESEVQTLYYIKSKLSGSVTKRNSKTYRWRLHSKLGMLQLIHLINGKLKHPNKHKQLSKVCYSGYLGLIVPRLNNNISRHNSWFSGFFDAEGSINCNSTNYQLSISIRQKNKTILNNIAKTLEIGYVNEDKKWEGYKYYATSISDLQLIVSYFNNYPLISIPKSTDLITLKRLMFKKQRGDHLLPQSSPKFRAFINLVNILISRPLLKAAGSVNRKKI
jgi:uncharacterized phage-like protein YoqJ